MIYNKLEPNFQVIYYFYTERLTINNINIYNI